MSSFCKPGGVEGLRYWQVDAFTTTAFKGNPAAVFCGYEQQVTDAKMQAIATETNMPITVFFLIDDEHYNFVVVKWFTTTAEIPLCGHGTLAVAHIYFTILAPNASTLRFNTASAGFITVRRNEVPSSAYYTMSFPVIPSKDTSDLSAVPDHILNAVVGHTPVSAHRAKDCWMLVFENEQIIRNAQLMTAALSKCPPSENRLIITSQAVEKAGDAEVNQETGTAKPTDCVSRVFHLGVEDAVCGSAHCTIGPYWANRLQKSELVAYQASPRGGTLHLRIDTEENNVFITGTAVTILAGNMVC